MNTILGLAILGVFLILALWLGQLLLTFIFMIFVGIGGGISLVIQWIYKTIKGE